MTSELGHWTFRDVRLGDKNMAKQLVLALTPYVFTHRQSSRQSTGRSGSPQS